MDPSARTIDRRLWLVVLVLVAVELALGVGLGPLHRALVVALFLLFGLPHGALDLWMWRRSSSAVPLSRFLLAYLGLAGAQLGLWIVAPTAAFLVFLTAAVHHFGTGDLNDLDVAPAARRAAEWTRGAMLVGLPLLLHADTVGPVLSAMNLDPAMLTPTDRPGWAAGLVALHVVALVRAQPGRPRLAHEIAQTLVWTTMFAALHPLLAFTLHFTLWHARSHALEMRRAFGGKRTSWLGLARAGAVPAGLAAVILVSWLQREPTGSIEGTAGHALILTSALTLPHVVFVSVARRRVRES